MLGLRSRRRTCPHKACPRRRRRWRRGRACMQPRLNSDLILARYSYAERPVGEQTLALLLRHLSPACRAKQLMSYQSEHGDWELVAEEDCGELAVQIEVSSGTSGAHLYPFSGGNMQHIPLLRRQVFESRCFCCSHRYICNLDTAVSPNAHSVAIGRRKQDQILCREKACSRLRYLRQC